MKVRIGWWVNEFLPDVIYKLEQSINQSIQFKPLSRLWLKGRAKKNLAPLGRVEKELAVSEVAEGGWGLPQMGLLFFPSFFSNLSFSPSFLFTPSSTRQPVHRVLIVEGTWPSGLGCWISNLEVTQWLKSSTVLLSGFLLDSPEFNSSTMPCK